ncbi:Inactive ubiquitin carboxyl-terminal hydrolase 17-like protein [Seminavis robusta]|uniref:Ubiquitin carboxyl-terminal hydrolase n=1 Tax=Seminavis robusta TaxID=568900 RepID=A0A9N8DH23_9STRA|nr:Inactive ubiquitin carboxyl-terminal hydrolase 17-like protein [Seminavis robusta]|eukprot:Sro63_g036020.1 Inactive ubiquitin carboxyl-terminal hydrolase 17-like protein (656) ;mRNA; f:118378-120345
MGKPSPRVPIRGGSATHVAVSRRERIETHDTHSEELKREARPKGFLNVGNTCYANAALQCLLSTALASALLDPKRAAVIRRYSSNPNLLAMGSGSVDSEDPDDSESEQKRKMSRREKRRKEREDRKMYKTCQWLTKELRMITKDYVSSSSPRSPSLSNPSMRVLEWLGSSDSMSGHNIVNPGSITRHPDQLSKCLRPYRQEDAHEFLRALLSTLVMNGHNKQLSCLFDGLLESAVTCQTCRRPSLTRDRYMDLSLDIYGDHILTLADALNEFTKTEILTGENKVFCQKCDCKRTASKGLRLATAPSILVCHLKRFAFDDYGNLRRLHKRVKFPLRLEIGDYMSKVNKSKPPPYELVGVLVHQGSTCDSGHYLAYVRMNGQWFKCNDSEVTKVDVKTVLKQQAYILMYQVEEMRRDHGLRQRTRDSSSVATRERQRSRRPSGRSKHHPQKSNILSLLCGVDVLEEHSFLSELCCRTAGAGDASVSPIGTGFHDSMGVELVATLRDDATVASTVCDSTVESAGSSLHQGPAFRKSASSSNLREIHDEASSSYMTNNEKVKPPRIRQRCCTTSNSDDESNHPHRTFTSTYSDPGADDHSPEYKSLGEAKWSAERISRHNWKYRDLPPLPSDPYGKRHRRSSSVHPTSPVYAADKSARW